MKQQLRAIQFQIETILTKQCDGHASLPDLIAEYPEDTAHGDIAFPVFSYARILKQSPKDIATTVVSKLDTERLGITKLAVVGGYINVFLQRRSVVTQVLDEITAEKDVYGRNSVHKGKTVAIEFSSPNTNKPLHLGHLRNNAIGEAVSRLLRASGAQVHQLCLFNDRGVHICKSMVAYQESAAGSTPQSEAKRGDSFVGDLYVKFTELAEIDPSYEEKAQAMLKAWEAGDEAVRSLWKSMRSWVTDGILATYKRCDIQFDAFEYESEIYERGREIVLDGLAQNIFYEDSDHSICVDLSQWGLDTKILLRSDRTTLYVTQDIATAVQRAENYHCDRMIYVVANEQEYHFSVLFKILELLGYVWARSCRHLSYGMVQLPDGRMKSREGSVVDADDLIDALQQAALDSMQEKRTQANDIEKIAESIALGALHYYLLWPHPSTEILFDTKKSLAFTGNTGPYIQYTCTRINSLERKARTMGITAKLNSDALTKDIEWELVKALARCPDVVGQAAVQENPSILAHYAYDLAKLFTMYYHEIPILSDDPRAAARLLIARCVGQTLRNCLYLLVIPSVEEM